MYSLPSVAAGEEHLVRAVDLDGAPPGPHRARAVAPGRLTARPPSSTSSRAGRRDRLGVDARRVQLLLGRGRAGHRTDGEAHQAGHGPAVEEGVEDRVAEAALLVVVLDGQQTAGRPRRPRAGCARSTGLTEYRSIDPDRDALAVQRVGGLQRLVHGRRRPRRRSAGRASGGAQHLAAADRELLVGAVEHRALAARGAQIADAVAGRPSRRPAGRSGWRRTGTARSSRAPPGTSPGPPGPSARARPGRWRRPRASRRG